MITSTANQQVKQLIQLNKKRKLRDERGVFIAEGPKMIEEAPRERIEKVYVAAGHFKRYKERLSLEELDYELMEDSVFRTVSDTQTPQGILAMIRQESSSLEAMLRPEHPLLLLLENIQDPGNLGTILRTAEGAGVTGVILSRGCVDLYNPKTIRSTMGSVYRVPTLYAENLCEMVSVLHEKGVRTFAAHLAGKNEYDQEDYRGGAAFLIGNEGNGLTEELSACADTLIRIPMEGRLESLNAGVAASVLMYEAYRQRRRGGSGSQNY